MIGIFPRQSTHVAMGRHTGTTLVELLVVVAVVGMLAALLLPAIQAARESSRRSHCQNNLRQVALAVLNYATTHQGELPPLWHTDRPEPWENFAWRASVLPFLERAPLFDSLEMDHPPLSTLNRRAVATIISSLQCPSTPESPRLVQSLGTPNLGHNELLIGACDYTAVHDVSVQDAANSAPAAWRSVAEADEDGQIPGMILPDLLNPHIRARPAKLKAIADGLSRTALVVEQAGKPLRYGLARNAENVLPTEGAWATGEFSSFYSGGINVDNLSGLYGFHAGAAAAMCDGSVHLFSENMELEVVTALLSRDGDEIIADNDWQ